MTKRWKITPKRSSLCAYIKILGVQMLKAFWFSCLGAVLLQGSLARAQYYNGPQPVQYMQPQYCYLEYNPHSYACQSWVFQGNPMFPLNIIDWKNVIEGEWKTITYANPWSDNDGPEFKMLVRPENPRIPVGVVNKNDDSLMGSLTFQGDKAIWTNWRGKRLKTKISEYAISDSYTFKFSFKDGDDYEQSFICRDFNRNNKHHLSCSWYLIKFTDYYHSAYTYEHRGFFGFLKPSDMGAANPPAYATPIPVNPMPSLPPPISN
jgi:hypothetical protein